MNNFLSEEKNDLKEIWRRIKQKDFSGNTGQAVKNSVYQFSQNIIFKLGSLFFTMMLARILLPEKMGLYNLALSTIVFFAVFSDLGISETLITYCSRMLGFKNFSKAKSYAKILFKWKINLILFSSSLILATSYLVSQFYYHKPLFFALLMGALYLPIVSLIGFIESLLKSAENFKTPFIKEILFQITRFIIVPMTLLFFLNSKLSNQAFVVATLFALTFSYFISLLFLIFSARKKINFLKVKSNVLDFKEKSKLKKFIFPLSTIAFSGIFFGYIDTIMLGRYVSTPYIAYYGVAFSLISSGAVIINFISTAIMPTFARKQGGSLAKFFKRARFFVILLSILGTIFAYFISYPAIRYAYGNAYLPAVPLLKLFSFLILILPLLSLYTNYFISQGKTKEIAGLLIASTILNIIFNFFGIRFGLAVSGEIGALYGALIATFISRMIYLAGFFIFKNRESNKNF